MALPALGSAPMGETLFEELKRYVNFSPADEGALRALHGALSPQFERVAEVFYARILDHAEARKALEGGESMVGRLKITLVAWMDSLLQGPWDEAYYERRARIGRVHVRISLPQHYMFGAMNVVRRELVNQIDQLPGLDAARREAARTALSKILDLELAIMLHTYREDLLAQQARVERLSTFGQLVGSIGHELRNPLGVMETSLYILKGRVGTDERAAKHVERIGEQISIANGIVTQLLDMIRDRPLVTAPVRLPELLAEAVAAVPSPAGVSVRVTVEEGLPPVRADALQLRQVFVNLLDNAVHASPPQGVVELTAVRAGAQVEVAVEDSGAGVDPAIRARLFEPLITTKAKGIGLGLALVKRFVERHGGTIAYKPRERGARFVVRLPAAEEP